ncbi:MAG: alpha/beta hydrolase [Flavobacteriales bacterium]|nr:alpha/beta hydrolase [Flavobacteriales bacterium]
MLVSKNGIIKGKYGKPILMEYGYIPNGIKKPIIVFAHGFKGFKDWGHFNKVMEFFIENGFAFVKFNFSHNGGTIDQPIDFPDLEAFGNNNFTKELNDLRCVIDWVVGNNEIPTREIDTEQIYLIGHSRGGGVAILAANEDKRIKKLVTWAAVSDLVNRYDAEVMEHWKKEGVLYIANGRTKQQMPLYYQLAEDTIKNKDRFNIEKAASKLTVPHLIVHGTSDEVVPVAEAKNINQWNKHSEITILSGGDHTFGTTHPYVEKTLKGDVAIVLDKTLEFIKG